MLRVRAIMTGDVITVSADMSLREAVELLSARRISGAPVLSGGRVVGTLSANDVVQFAAATPGTPAARDRDDWIEDDELSAAPDEDEPAGTFYTELWPDAGAGVAERFDAVDGPEWDVLAEHTVEEAMSRAVVSVAPDDDVADAAERLRRAGAHRALVLERRRLVGIVTTTDITRAVAERRLGGAPRTPPARGGGRRRA